MPTSEMSLFDVEDTLHKGGGKHRYVYILGSKTQRRQRLNLLRYPILPYPKHNQGGTTTYKDGA